VLVGDKRRFAVEFKLDPQKLADAELKEWLFGRICFWCGAERVGSFDEEATIRDVALEAERFLRHAGKREDKVLMAAPRTMVIGTIVSALYVDSGQSDERVREDWERFSRFVVSPEVDVFDAWRLLLVEGGGGGRLIWAKKSETEAKECLLQQGEFDSVLEQFLSALRREAACGS